MEGARGRTAGWERALVGALLCGGGSSWARCCLVDGARGRTAGWERKLVGMLLAGGGRSWLCCCLVAGARGRTAGWERFLLDDRPALLRAPHWWGAVLLDNGLRCGSPRTGGELFLLDDRLALMFGRGVDRAALVVCCSLVCSQRDFAVGTGPLTAVTFGMIAFDYGSETSGHEGVPTVMGTLTTPADTLSAHGVGRATWNYHF